MNLSIEELIEKCQPGKHFLGLWIYRQHNVRSRPPKWTVTFFDHAGQYWETKLRDTPQAALYEALLVISKEPR